MHPPMKSRMPKVINATPNTCFLFVSIISMFLKLISHFRRKGLPKNYKKEILFLIILVSFAREPLMSGQNEEDKAKPPPEKVIE